MLKTIKFFGGTYVGETVNELPNGEGVYSFVDGRVYKGQFKRGKMHGLGTLTWPDGSSLFGRWENDEYIETIITD